MKAIIVDDEVNGIITLQKMLERNCPEVDILATCSDALDAWQKLQELSPDVIFLDIQMPGKTGIEMLMELPAKKFEVVFVTAYNEYMLQALQYSAADYLLKPVDEDRLTEAVQRVEKRMDNERGSRRVDMLVSTLIYNINKTGFPQEMRLCLPTLRGFTMVNVNEVIYCEAERNYTVFHFLNDKPVLVCKSLIDYDDLLSSTTFLRIHRSFLINLHHVKEYQRGEGGMVVMNNGAQIEVSRRRKEYFIGKLKEHFKF